MNQLLYLWELVDDYKRACIESQPKDYIDYAACTKMPTVGKQENKRKKERKTR